MGGKPKRSTPADMRLKRNNPSVGKAKTPKPGVRKNVVRTQIANYNQNPSQGQTR